jgi:hypothetical protein
MEMDRERYKCLVDSSLSLFSSLHPAPLSHGQPCQPPQPQVHQQMPADPAGHQLPRGSSFPESPPLAPPFWYHSSSTDVLGFSIFPVRSDLPTHASASGGLLRDTSLADKLLNLDTHFPNSSHGCVKADSFILKISQSYLP